RAVLVVAASGYCIYVDLVAIVFAGVFPVKSNLDRVVAPDLRQAIGDRIDRAARMRRVWPASEAVEGRNVDRRYLSRNVLAAEQVRIVDAELRAIESGQGRVYRNVNVVQTKRGAGFVHHRWGDGPGPGERVCLVGTVEVFSRQARALVERLILKIRVVGAADCDVMLLVRENVSVPGTFALVDGMRSLGDPVLGALSETGRGRGIGVHDRDSVRAQTALRNDVSGKGLAARGSELGTGSRIIDRVRTAVPRVGPKQFAEIALPHERSGDGLRLGIRKAIARPFLGHEEEKLVSKRFPNVRNRRWAADIEAEIVITERRSEVGGRREIPLPCIGVHRGIAEILEQGAMEIRAAALGDDANLAACGTPVLGGVVRRQHLDFLSGIDVRNRDAGAVG